jgi:hypothetical protein
LLHIDVTTSVSAFLAAIKFACINFLPSTCPCSPLLTHITQDVNPILESVLQSLQEIQLNTRPRALGDTASQISSRLMTQMLDRIGRNHRFSEVPCCAVDAVSAAEGAPPQHEWHNHEDHPEEVIRATQFLQVRSRAFDVITMSCWPERNHVIHWPCLCRNTWRSTG